MGENVVEAHLEVVAPQDSCSSSNIQPTTIHDDAWVGSFVCLLTA